MSRTGALSWTHPTEDFLSILRSPVACGGAMSVIYTCPATGFPRAWELPALCQWHPHFSLRSLRFLSDGDMVTVKGLRTWDKRLPLKTRILLLNLLSTCFSFYLDKVDYYFPPPSPMLLTRWKVIASRCLMKCIMSHCSCGEKPFLTGKHATWLRSAEIPIFVFFFLLSFNKKDLYSG